MQKLKEDRIVDDSEREELDFFGSIFCPCKERFATAYRGFEERYNAGKNSKEKLHGVVPSEHRLDDRYHNLTIIKTKEKFPAITTAGGYLEFLRTDFIANAENGFMRGWFAARSPASPVHPFFEGLQLHDPKNIFSIYGAMPYILVVNHKRLKERKAPRRIADLIAPEFRSSIAVPYSIDDITEHLLLSIWKNYGSDGIEALARNVIMTGRAPELIADAIAHKDDGACVYLMTWFFANTVPKRDYLEIVWPQDGALLCPLYAVLKAELSEKQKAAAAFLFGAELGQAMADGWYTHINPDVRYKLPPDKTQRFQWIGWDYIYEKPLDQRVAEIETVFRSAHDHIKPYSLKC
jgi:ABC-type Fe3+ transport system substrate-binding protein